MIAETLKYVCDFSGVLKRKGNTMNSALGEFVGCEMADKGPKTPHQIARNLISDTKQYIRAFRFSQVL